MNINEFKSELSDHILPFWIELKDEKHGGFYGEVDYYLNVNKEGGKGGIATARFLWSFSAAYNATQNKKYLDIAKHSYDFLVNKVIDKKNKGIYWMLNFQGESIDTRKHIYAQAFGVYALSEYYMATKDEEALNYAMDLFNIIENLGYNIEKNAYKEEFDMKWNETSNEMLSENGVIASITTNTHLHVLEAYTNLYKIWPSENLKQRLENLIYIFYEKIYNDETQHLKVFFDKNWEEIIDLKSYGHDIEASWLIDEAMKVVELKDEKISKMILDIACNIEENAIDADGAILNEKENNVIDHTKVWWVQSEAIVGFYNAYENSQDEKFLEAIEKVWDYTKKNIIDKRSNGEWVWSVETDGSKTIRDIAEPWKTPYHNSRLCLEMMKRMGENDK
ncbi:MAG: AGE family epimerase/isomerase [Clostridiaceae bacterium]